MNMLMNEELVKYAEAIKDFCSLQDCDDCLFHDHKAYLEDGCVLGVPVDWSIKKLRTDG